MNAMPRESCNAVSTGKVEYDCWVEVRSMRWPVLVLSLIALEGCSSAARDFENICNAETRSGITDSDPAERTMKLADWISKNISSKEAIETFQSLGAVAPEDRGRLLKQAAVEAGYRGPCPMAETGMGR